MLEDERAKVKNDCLMANDSAERERQEQSQCLPIKLNITGR